MPKYWVSFVALTGLILVLIWSLPDTYHESALHKGWLYLETILLAIVSGLLFAYNRYLVSDDAYSRMQSIYVGTFAKFLIVAGVVAAYILNNRNSFTRVTLLALMIVYLIYLVYVSVIAIKQSRSYGSE